MKEEISDIEEYKRSGEGSPIPWGDSEEEAEKVRANLEQKLKERDDKIEKLEKIRSKNNLEIKSLKTTVASLEQELQATKAQGPFLCKCGGVVSESP